MIIHIQIHVAAVRTRCWFLRSAHVLWLRFDIGKWIIASRLLNRYIFAPQSSDWWFEWLPERFEYYTAIVDCTRLHWVLTLFHQFASQETIVLQYTLHHSLNFSDDLIHCGCSCMIIFDLGNNLSACIHKRAFFAGSTECFVLYKMYRCFLKSATLELKFSKTPVPELAAVISHSCARSIKQLTVLIEL